MIFGMAENLPRIFRLIVPVSDLETAAGFYSRLLGFVDETTVFTGR